MKRDLNFRGNGQLAAALGIDRSKSEKVDAKVNEMVDRRATLKEIIEEFNENWDMDDAEWSVFMFSLGYLNCALGY